MSLLDAIQGLLQGGQAQSPQQSPQAQQQAPNPLGDVLTQAIPLALGEIQRQQQIREQQGIMNSAMGAGILSPNYGAPNIGAGMANYAGAYQQLRGENREQAYRQARLQQELLKMIEAQRIQREKMELETRKTDLQETDITGRQQAREQRWGEGGMEQRKLEQRQAEQKEQSRLKEVEHGFRDREARASEQRANAAVTRANRAGMKATPVWSANPMDPSQEFMRLKTDDGRIFTPEDPATPGAPYFRPRRKTTTEAIEDLARELGVGGAPASASPTPGPAPLPGLPPGVSYSVD